MNREIINTLNHLNATFYHENSESFDRTRQSAWPGWERVVKELKSNGNLDVFRLLDVACGNMRFEKYLLECLPDIKLQAICVDSCDELAISIDGCEYRNCDIVCNLASGTPLDSFWDHNYDMVVSFGFFHHIPSAQLRLRLLEELVAATKPNGLVEIQSLTEVRKKALSNKISNIMSAKTFALGGELKDVQANPIFHVRVKKRPNSIGNGV